MLKTVWAGICYDQHIVKHHKGLSLSSSYKKGSLHSFSSADPQQKMFQVKENKYVFKSSLVPVQSLTFKFSLK